MRSLFVLMTIAVAIGFVVSGLINSLDDRALARSERAAQMRVGVAVAEFARRVGLSQDWVAYCRAETRRKLSTYPKDGSIPLH
ncbi:hypothetical protein VQ02_26165, partial [Methylobacterium variabile]